MPWQWRAHGTVKTQLPSQSDLFLSVLTSPVSVNSATPRKMSFSSSVSTYIHEPIAWTHHWPGGLQDHLLHFHWLVFQPVVAAVTASILLNQAPSGVYRRQSLLARLWRWPLGTLSHSVTRNRWFFSTRGQRLWPCLVIFWSGAAGKSGSRLETMPVLLPRCPHYLHHWSDWLVVRLPRRITSQLSLRWRCPSKGDSKLSYQDWNALPAPGSFFRCMNRKQPCGVTSWLFCNWRALSLV